MKYLSYKSYGYNKISLMKYIDDAIELMENDIKLNNGNVIHYIDVGLRIQVIDDFKVTMDKKIKYIHKVILNNFISDDNFIEWNRNHGIDFETIKHRTNTALNDESIINNDSYRWARCYLYKLQDDAIDIYINKMASQNYKLIVDELINIIYSNESKDMATEIIPFMTHLMAQYTYNYNDNRSYYGDSESLGCILKINVEIRSGPKNQIKPTIINLN